MLLIEIIALVFLCRKNGQLAAQKGLKPNNWKLYTVLAWLGAEFIGWIIAVMIFIDRFYGFDSKQAPDFNIKQLADSDILAMSGIALLSAFGGYLLIRYILENKPNAFDNGVNQIRADDLQPPKKNS